MNSLTSLCVLAVDDDADTLANLCDILHLDGHEVVTARSAREALGRDDWSRISAILLDRKLPDADAEFLLPKLRKLAPHAAVIVVTGYADVDFLIKAMREGAADYISKPINPDLIRNRLAQIAERRQSEKEIHRLNRDLQNRVAELQTLLDVIPIGIAITQDVDCHWVHANPALARLLGIARSPNVSFNLPGSRKMPFHAFQNGKELTTPDLPLQKVAASGQEIHGEEIDIVRPQGDRIQLLSYIAPLRDDDGNPRGAVGAFLDITERKRAEEHALQSERLAGIGQMMTGLAHESGNALSRSQSCLEMLTWEVEDRPAALDLIERIQSAQDHLRQLYEEVRNYAAPLRLEFDVHDVSAVWKQAWENLALRRKNRTAVLNAETGSVRLRCRMDAFRMEQVFRNIFDNSLAASSDPVTITVRCGEMEMAQRPMLQIRIMDNGPGLSLEQTQRIFEPFFTTKTKGTGLGMAIAKRIVEAHGGQVEVGKSAASGAEIVISLPRE